ncbi:hypothetical protein VTL71DRAFT_7832 [Oculimacula yallundae]|uniref:Uncharacterized protein n=1 Tax=Oculimacula yallundae TaxID=86028 RepID=A0ABR4CVW3_9HELO
MSFILRSSRFAASRSIVATRPFSSTSLMANKELCGRLNCESDGHWLINVVCGIDTSKSESHEKEKKGGKLSTDSEEAVHADRQSKETIEELQKKSTEHLEKKK